MVRWNGMGFIEYNTITLRVVSKFLLIFFKKSEGTNLIQI